MLTCRLHSRVALALCALVLTACEDAGDARGGGAGTSTGPSAVTTLNPGTVGGAGAGAGDSMGDESPATTNSADTGDTGTTGGGATGTAADTSTSSGPGETSTTDSGGSTGTDSRGATTGIGMTLTVDELSPGELQVTEVMYDPNACDDTVCEWIEIYNASGSPIDIQGLRIEDIAGFFSTIDASVVLGAGDYGILARTDAAQFGYTSFDPIAYYGVAPALNNSGSERVVLLGTGGVVLHQSPAWNGQESDDDGVSFKRHPNDGSWCYSTSVFEGTDRGSPGAANEAACNVPLPGGICMDIDVAAGTCTDTDEDDCTCVGCADNGVCDGSDDCICGDCSADAFCSNAANCVDDGFCSPYVEGCACADCADHPFCA